MFRRWSSARHPFRGVYVGIWLSMTCFSGCQGQGEGEQCNRLAGNNGNDDCQSGLVCDTSVTSTPGFGRCCPTDRTRATTTVCKGTAGGINANPEPPEGGANATMESGASSSDGAAAADAAAE
jgi:hypothetical protein